MLKKCKSVVLAAVCLMMCLLACACGAGETETAAVPEATQTPVEVTAEPTPTAKIVTLPDGTSVEETITTLDLTALTDADAQAAARVVAQLPQLMLIELGQQRDSLSWDSVELIFDARGAADINYAFTLYGNEYHLADTRMDINHIPIDDGGALVRQVVSCMPNLNYLDMDSCGVADDDMAVIRAELPEVRVIWRVWFGESYSVRTDTERILASKPSRGGILTADDCKVLKYCTEVKYLDLGYNTLINDISFVSSMPKLEVAILARNEWSDARPLADCPKLEYLEMQDTSVSDLTPLSGLKNLRHLNICNCIGITDISPLYGLTELERLWIGYSIAVPAEQVAQMQTAAPNCVIDTMAAEGYEGMWRSSVIGDMYPLHERYIELLEQFDDYDEEAYSYYWNDPKY